jgi:hypothetical protein
MKVLIITICVLCEDEPSGSGGMDWMKLAWYRDKWQAL